MRRPFLTIWPSATWPLAAAALIAALTIAAAWPGVATYDTAAQFGEVLSGAYDDWHPPAMARWWAVLHAVFGGGTGPMLVMQVALAWLGLGLVAAALVRRGDGMAGAAVLACGLLPVFWVWQIAVLKDAQMLGAALAGVGLVAWWRLAGVRVPRWGWALAGVAFGYATLVRANAVFAIAPLVAMLAVTRRRTRAAWAAAMMLAALGAMQIVNHEVFGAVDTGVRTTQPRFDLAGIAVRVADPAVTRIGVAQVEALRIGHCVKPFFWDPLGDGPCADAEAALADLSVTQLYVTLARAILHHPVAYAEQRIAHLNSTERWLVPAGWPDAWPPSTAEPNPVGLRGPGPAAAWWIGASAWLAESPLAWPIVWTVAAIVALVAAARRRPSPRRELAMALLISALTLEASFAIISIASDLRYHLWPMVATALAVVLLADHRPSRRMMLGAGAGLALVIVTGATSRMTLPPAPASYRAMLAD